jgi:hypothetical protein
LRIRLSFLPFRILVSCFQVSIECFQSSRLTRQQGQQQSKAGRRNCRVSCPAVIRSENQSLVFKFQQLAYLQRFIACRVSLLAPGAEGNIFPSRFTGPIQQMYPVIPWQQFVEQRATSFVVEFGPWIPAQMLQPWEVCRDHEHQSFLLQFVEQRSQKPANLGCWHQVEVVEGNDEDVSLQTTEHFLQPGAKPCAQLHTLSDGKSGKASIIIGRCRKIEEKLSIARLRASIEPNQLAQRPDIHITSVDGYLLFNQFLR